MGMDMGMAMATVMGTVMICGKRTMASVAPGGHGHVEGIRF